MKKVIKTLVFISLTAAAGISNADVCSRGVIYQVKEGGWNSDDLFIKMDERNVANQHPGTDFHGWFRFRANELSEVRMNAIRTQVYLALATGPRLFEVRSQAGDCSRADEVTLYDDVY